MRHRCSAHSTPHSRRANAAPCVRLPHVGSAPPSRAGVLWQESIAIPGAVDALRALHNMVRAKDLHRAAPRYTGAGALFLCANVTAQNHSCMLVIACNPLCPPVQGKLLLFATNNSGKSREQNLAKFRQLGFDFGITTVSQTRPPRPPPMPSVGAQLCARICSDADCRLIGYGNTVAPAGSHLHLVAGVGLLHLAPPSLRPRDAKSARHRRGRHRTGDAPSRPAVH